MILERLNVLYDADCGFCGRARTWLSGQPQLVELEFLPRDAPEVPARFPGLEPGHDELVVVDDQGGVYRGPDAFLMCLFALENYRAWSLRLSSPELRPLARKGLELVSSQRHRINDWLGLKSDREVARSLDAAVGRGSPRCSA